MSTKGQISKAKALSQESALQFIERFLREQNRFLKRYASQKVRKQRVRAVRRDGPIVTITTSGAGPRQRRRYLLRNLNGAWKLIGSKLECSLCSGTGRLASGVACFLCKTAGWTIV